MCKYIMTSACIVKKIKHFEYFCYFVANQFSQISLWPTFESQETGDDIVPSLSQSLLSKIDESNRSTWPSCFYGGLRGFLCSEKKLVSFLKSN